MGVRRCRRPQPLTHSSSRDLAQESTNRVINSPLFEHHALTPPENRMLQSICILMPRIVAAKMRAPAFGASQRASQNGIGDPAQRTRFTQRPAGASLLPDPLNPTFALGHFRQALVQR